MIADVVSTGTRTDDLVMLDEVKTIADDNTEDETIKTQSPSPSDTPDTLDTGERYLGENYSPNEFDVICGRGRSGRNHEGNLRFNMLIAENLTSYVEAKRKKDMTGIVTKIVRIIHDGGGNFIKKDAKGGWQEIGTKASETKVRHTFRDWMGGNMKGVTGSAPSVRSKW